MFVHLDNLIKSESKISLNKNVDFSRFVEHVPEFLSCDNFDEELLADVVSLGMFNKKNSNKTVSQWLSSDSRDYCFSDSPRFKHPPKPISAYPGINKLLKKVNDSPITTQDLDAALVIVYNTKQAALNFHDDAEQLIDGNSSIATVSFGATRTMEFCRKGVTPSVPEHSFPVSNHDLVVMKPGCQEALKHRILQGSGEEDSANDWRVCISFRKITPVHETDPDISFGDVKVEANHSGVTKLSPSPQKINLVVGDSFSEGLNAEKLGRNGRKRVINLSRGGASIDDVSKQLDDFFVTNTTPVSKIFVCVGANDIRNCREKGVRHLKSPLNDLARKIKTQFPSASVWFQSLIPFPHQHRYTEVNVMQYNDLLYEICMLNHIFYLDCFNSYLTYDGFRSENLFLNFNNIHPNRHGYSLLARIYLNIIHSKRFNPLGY